MDAAEEGDDVPMEMGTTEAEDVLIRLARHLLFACGNTREDAFKHVLLFITGSFGRHCRVTSCSRGDKCALRGLAVWDPEDPLTFANAVLQLPTPISLWANIVREMRSDALGGRLSAFELVTEKHAALLASLIFPSAYPQSLKAKCFSLFGSYIAEDGRFYSTTPANIAAILATFDGQTKTFFPATPEDCTELLKADMANVTRREFCLSEYGVKPSAKKRRGGDDDAAGVSDLAPGWIPLSVDFDSTGPLYIQKLALAEMEALTSDGQQTARIGRVGLTPSGEELVVGKALNARSDKARGHVPAMTISRFPRIIFNPAPLDKAPVYAGGGEASALADIAQLKRNGRVTMTPDYCHPDPVIGAVTMADVHQAGDPNYNRFRGFHGDHAYAAFHPSDVRCHGVFKPDMTIPADLVLAGAQGYLAAGAGMTLPTVAAFFEVGAPVSAAAYAAGATLIQKHCTGLAAYLSFAAKWHQRVNLSSSVPKKDKVVTLMDSVAGAVRGGGTFAAVVQRVNDASGPRDACGKRVAAAILHLAACFYPTILDEYGDMVQEYINWYDLKDVGQRKPHKFILEADACDVARRAATLTMCGYIFLPDSVDIGVTDVFQLSGEGRRYGEFGMLPLNKFQHGVMAVDVNLTAGLVGYRVRGHAAHTLKTAHRIILLDAVKELFGDGAEWAGTAAARAWVTPPEGGFWTVQSCSKQELVVQRGEERSTLKMAVHTCTASGDCSGTVVPVVFNLANELVFERATRCPRGAEGNARELHGAQLLQPGDEVTMWTTPSAEDPGQLCLVAARVWNLGGALLPEVNGLEGLAFDIVDSGTQELPTPLETLNAVIAYGVVHRQPSTVVPYLFSPTKTGGDATPGQGLGKTELVRRALAAVGPNLVDMVNDHERLVKNDQFNDKGYASIFTLIDDVSKPEFLLSQSTKAGATAKENEARVKCKGNKKSDNYNTTVCTGNEYCSLDAAEKANEDEQRRLLLIRAWSCFAGMVSYFSYIYGTYFNVNPLIQKCILEYWRTLPGVDMWSTGELQVLAKKCKVYWSGQVPMHVGFLQKLYEAPRMEANKLKQAKTTEALAGKSYSLLSGFGTAQKDASEKDMLAAARQYVQENYDARSRNPGRIRENAQLIIQALKTAAESGEGAVWTSLYHLAQLEGQMHKQMCFSVQKEVLKAVVEACGYRVYDTVVSEDDAPVWPPAERGGGEEAMV
jgi:hypothetical protein